jgi:bifunctional enzyme CysN/CysC
MVSGAARAEAAFLVIDAREGIRENSRRHGYLLGLLGIRQVAVLVNKMDLVEYRQTTFEALADEYTPFLEAVGVPPAVFIPVSGAHGDNLARRSAATPWYAGPTALEALDQFRPEAAATDKPLRIPIQDVYKFTAGGDDRRIVAGTIESGTLRVGDTVVFHPSGKRSRVRTIEGFNRPPALSAGAGTATGFTLEEQVYVTRGQVAAREGEPPPRDANRVSASLFWLGKRPLVRGRDYILKLGTARVSARLERIERVIDAADLRVTEHKPQVERHDVADVVLRLRTPIAIDLVEELSATSRFVVVDQYEISGGGIVRAVLEAGQQPATEPSPAVVWLTGLSGAGKSTIAERLCLELGRLGARVEHLDGDAVRQLFPTGFTREERDEHIRRIGFLASRLERHGVIVVASFVSPYRESRHFVRGLCRRFLEVHVATPLEECERRDAKGLYRRARRGEITRFTGIDDPYEPPELPELTIDTRELTAEEASRLILQRLTEETDGHGAPGPAGEPQHPHPA